MMQPASPPLSVATPLQFTTTFDALNGAVKA